jgi:hypothetical protein
MAIFVEQRDETNVGLFLEGRKRIGKKKKRRKLTIIVTDQNLNHADNNAPKNSCAGNIS